MPVVFDTDAKEFLKKHGQTLQRREAEHNLILSLCQMAIAKGRDSNIRMATLLDDEGFVLAAVQTPPHNIVLSHGDANALQPLVDAVKDAGWTFPGIVGPSDVSASFQTLWTEKTGEAPIEYMDQIIYSLVNVQMPPAIDGQLRWAKPDEAKRTGSWIRAFSADALPQAEQISDKEAAKRAEDMIKAQRLAVWDVKGKAVAQAGVSGTAEVARISMVYTPVEERGNGYASAVVANLSAEQLKAGKKMCCLYADARNPVSNSIYRKIGYEFAGRSSLYVLSVKPEVA